MDRYIDFLESTLLDDIGTAIKTFHEYSDYYKIKFTGCFADDLEIITNFWRTNPEVLLIEYQTQLI